MDSNRNAEQGGAATGPSSGVGPDLNTSLDWRWQLRPDARQRIVNRIMDTLKRHRPVPVPEGINGLQKIAVRFEEKIYCAATSPSDYLTKISQKMLSLENNTQPGLNPSLPNQNRMDPGKGMISQQPSLNPGQSLGMPQVMNQPPASRQQLPILPGSHNMPTAAPGVPSGATINPMSGPSISNSNPMSGPSGSTGSLPTDMYSNTQRQQLPQQHMMQNQMLYHQQQLKMLGKQQQQQQQQQNVLPQNQMQMTSALAGGSTMMSAVPTGGMQQSQLNSIQQQPVGQGGSFQQQPLMRQQPQPTMQNPTMSMQLTNNVTDLQQQQLQMQPYQMQQRQLQPNQMQQNQMLNQQMMLGQQKSGGTGNMYNTQRQMQMQRQARLLQQQLPKQQHLPSQLQSQQQQLPQQQQPSMMQQRGMQMPRQQQQPSMMQQREMQMPEQQMQGSPALLQMQNNNAIDPQPQQQQQFIPQQQQRVLQDVASSPQTGHLGDGQEEIYQRLKYLKDTYFADLREIHQRLLINLSQLDSLVLPNARGGEQIEKMKHFKMVLERMMAVLQLGKHQMQIGLKDKLSLYEKQIQSILQNHKKAPQQQPQAGAPSDQPRYPGLQQSQPGLQSQQLPQQHQPQQMDNQNQLQQQLNTSAMPQLNNMGMPNSMQQGIQSTLQSDQHQANGTGFGSLQQGAMGSSMQNAKNPPQMVGSGAAIGSSNMSHTATMSGMQTNMSSAQVPKPQQQHQEQQIQPQQQMMQHRVIQQQPLLQSQQPQQINSQNQLQQQLNPSAMPQSNNIGVPNVMQQGIQNTLQSDQLQASSTGLGSLQQGAMGSSLQNTVKTRKCKICEDCVHKRRNSK